jgi:hypothetical protein
MIFPRVLCLVIVSSSLASLAAEPLLANDLGRREGMMWRPFLQWDLENPDSEGDPFDVSATVEFLHLESGETRRTEMFYDGGTTWAFRFTATKPGEWTFHTSSADRHLDGHVGSIDIAPHRLDDAHGFLKNLDGKWGWEGTEAPFAPQLVMWDYVAADLPLRHLTESESRIDALVDDFVVGHGFDGFHVAVIGGYWFDRDAESDRVESAMERPDPRMFAALETLIVKTHAAGGMVHLWAWGDHQRRQTARSLQGGIGGPIDRRLQRYIAARLGPIPGWSMGYGFDLDEWVTADQVRDWRDSLHRFMGWHHFLGGRPEGPNLGTDHSADAVWNRGLDYSSYEHHRPTYDVYAAAIGAVPGQPVLSEDRFRIRESQYPEKDYDPDRVRRGLYDSTLAGGVGNIWGIDPKLSPGGRFPNREQIRTYATFFNQRRRFLADMRPLEQINAAAETRVLWSPSAASGIVYRESGDRIPVDLKDAPRGLAIVAVDTLKPYAEIDLGELPAEGVPLRLPYVSDWVVAIGAFGGQGERIGAADFDANEQSFVELRAGPGSIGGHGAMWADIDSDGLPDLYQPLIFAETLPDLFLHNRGAGEFVEEGELRGIADPDGGSHGAAWCDLDNDGDYDLINGSTVDDGTGNSNDIFRNDGSGRFTRVRSAALEARREATRAFLSLDMDGDGDLDLFAVTGYLGTDDPTNELNEVYRNDGNLRFSEIDGGALRAARVGQGATDTDFDGDGDIDLLGANRTGPIAVLRNDGSGNFTEVDPSLIGIRHRAPDGITTADVDNDGDLDLMLAGSDAEAHLYLNDGHGNFTHRQSFTETVGYMAGFADLDNDGDLDLYFAGDSKIFLNDGEGNFTAGPSVSIPDARDPRGVAFADIDGDGDLDFAIGDKRAGRNFLFRNDLTRIRGGGHWLKVRLITRDGQAGAFGAKVFVHTASHTANDGDKNVLLGMRESRSNYGYLAQDDPVLHFGLGVHGEVDVTVRFLDGTQVTHRRVRADETVTIAGQR